MPPPVELDGPPGQAGGASPVVKAVGLGPAGPELTPESTRRAIADAEVAYLRTGRHPAADGIGAPTFDRLYETLPTLDEVYSAIVEELVEAASEHGSVVYAVPGSPLVCERTVEALRADQRVELEVEPALSFLDLAWDRLGLDPVAAGTRLVDGERFSVEAAGERGPLLVAQCWSPAVLSAIKLALSEQGKGALPPLTVLTRLGLPGELVRSVEWPELDREVEPDHLTTVFVPRLASPIAAEMARLAELVRTLREQCPWDKAQTHGSLTRHLLEETYEVLEAIESLDSSPASYAHLEEELGDLLFQVCFHSALAAEEGQFSLADVAGGIHDKLVGRHPHVFGSVSATSPEQVMRNWEQIKKAEKQRESFLDGIPRSLPSLLYSSKVQRKAEAVGIGDPEAPAAESSSLTKDQLGDLLFGAVALGRRAGLDPETALRARTEAFASNLRAAEAVATDRGLDLHSLSPEERAAVWREVGATGSPEGVRHI